MDWRPAVDQAKMIDMCEWSCILRRHCLIHWCLNVIAKALEWADIAKRVLEDAVKCFASVQSGDAAVYRQQAVGLFWSHLDAKAWRFKTVLKMIMLSLT